MADSPGAAELINHEAEPEPVLGVWGRELGLPHCVQGFWLEHTLLRSLTGRKEHGEKFAQVDGCGIKVARWNHSKRKRRSLKRGAVGRPHHTFG